MERERERESQKGRKGMELPSSSSFVVKIFYCWEEIGDGSWWSEGVVDTGGVYLYSLKFSSVAASFSSSAAADDAAIAGGPSFIRDYNNNDNNNNNPNGNVNQMECPSKFKE